MIGVAEVGLFGPVDQDHVGTHVRQQHAGERSWADAEELDDSQAG
jgi:hypothetical protein